MKKPIIIIIISSVIAIILLSIMVASYARVKDLDNQLTQSKKFLQKMKEEITNLSSDKEKMSKENEKLQADTVSYLGINTKLQQEKEDLLKKNKDGQKLIEDKEANLQRIKSRLEEIEKGITIAKTKEQNALFKEKKVLTKRMLSLSSTLKKERALYHYNLGVAYASAKLYDEAIDEYKKTLKENPDNADAYYNLALIYDTINGDGPDAIENYKKYLELKPNAEDRDEVEASMGRLK